MATDEKRGYVSIGRVNTAEELSDKFKKVREARRQLELDWRLNLHFYRGEQWSYANPHSGRIDKLETEEGRKPRFRVRLVSNQILPGVQNVVGQLTKTKPVIGASPTSGSEKDIRAAQMAESLFEYSWREFGLLGKQMEALTWSQLANKGYWKITWDEFAGKEMKVTLDPDGNPILNDSLKELYTAQLEQMGQKPQEKVLYVGDIAVDVMSPFNVFPDPNASSLEDADWVVCVHPMNPDDIYARFKINVEPDAYHDNLDVFASHKDSRGKSKLDHGEPEPTTKNVYYLYHKRTPGVPKGRYVVWLENPSRILVDEPWGLPTNDLPLVEFPGVRVPGDNEGEALVTHARMIQRELNRTLSQIVEHKNLMIRPRYFGPAGSMVKSITSEPGVYYEYTPVQGLKPEPEAMQNLPAYVFEHLKDIQQRLDRLFISPTVMRGETPPNVEAGYAIDLLQEMAVDAFAPTIQLQEQALVRAGKLIAALAHKYYQEPRLLKIRGEGGIVQVKKFLQADLDGGYEFYAEAGSGLPRSRAGKMMRIRELMQMQVIRPDQAWKHMDIADLRGIGQLFAAHEEQALREHEKILHGEPINILALEGAMQQIQQGVNPQTQMPFQNEEEAIAFIEQAAMQPLAHEASLAHREQHVLFMTSTEFEGLPPEVQRLFYMHLSATDQKIQSEQPQEPVHPRTSLQLRGTVGPTVAAKILDSNQVQTQPEEWTEPPLETMVFDDIDEPDQDEAGNDPFTEEERALSLARQEIEGGLKAARMAHEVTLAEKRAQEASSAATGNASSRSQELKEQQALQDMQIKQEKHEASLAETEHRMTLAERQARDKANQSEERPSSGT